MTVVRRVGSIHLILAGVINAVTGLTILGLSLSGWLIENAITETPQFMTPATALRFGDHLGFLATQVAPLIGVILLVLAVVQFAGGYHTYAGRHRWLGVTAGVLGAVNLLALPMGLIAVVLLGFVNDGQSWTQREGSRSVEHRGSRERGQ